MGTLIKIGVGFTRWISSGNAAPPYTPPPVVLTLDFSASDFDEADFN